MATNNQHDANAEAKRVQQALRRRLLVATLIGVAGFIVVLIVFYLTPLLPNGPHDVDWSLLEGYVSLVSLILVFGGAVFALWEYIRNEIQQQKDEKKVAFDVYLVIFDRLMNPEDTAARRWIIQNIPALGPDEDEQAWVGQVREIIHATPADWQGATPPGQTHVKRVLNTLDFVGFVAVHYWDMWQADDELVQWMSSPITKVWDRIGPYVEKEADERNERDYYQAARILSESCQEWRRAHHPPSRIIERAT